MNKLLIAGLVVGKRAEGLLVGDLATILGWRREFLSNVSPGRIHHLCGYADLSFTVVLSDRPFNELHQFRFISKVLS